MTQYDATLMEVLPNLDGFKAELTRLNREEKHSFESFINDSFKDLVDFSINKKTGVVKANYGYFSNDAKKQIEQIEQLQIKYTRLQTKVLYDVLFSEGEQKNKINEQVQIIAHKAVDILQEYTSLNILKYKINLGITGLGSKGLITRQAETDDLEATLKRNTQEIIASYKSLKEMVHFFYDYFK